MSMFPKLIQALGTVDVDLFASRLCHQVNKLARTSTCIDGRCISNKLDTPKSIRLPFFCSYRESVSQSNEAQVYFNSTSVTFPTMLHLVNEDVYTRSNFYSHISESFDRPKPEPTRIVSESNISLNGMEGFRQQYSAECLSDQILDLLEISRRPGTLHYCKTGLLQVQTLC